MPGGYGILKVMERNFFSEGFEGFLREKADQYKLYPSDRVWKNINRELHPRKKWPYLAAVLLLLGIGMGGRYYVQDKDDSTLNATNLPGRSSSDLQVASLNPAAGKDETPYRTDKAVSGSGLHVASRNSTLLQKRTKPASTEPILASKPSPRTTLTSPGEGNPTSSTTPLNAMASLKAGVEPDALGHADIASLDQLDRQLPSRTDHVQAQVKAEWKSPAAEPSVNEQQYTVNPVIPLTRFQPKARKLGWVMYVTPSVSYRRLSGKASNASYPSYSNVAYNANFGFPGDVNAAVNHRPSMGMELGMALVYPLNKVLRLKAGLQLNYNEYLIQAFSYVPEMASFGANNNGLYSTPINQVSFYRNFNGYSRTWLRNQHFMISMPVGFELNVVGDDQHVQFSLASTIQPTYMLNDNAFLLSTNLKNYAETPSLYRDWNVNGAVEAFLTIPMGSVKWVLGPQFRYQMLSSYTDNYPIREHLVDYGFKVGLKKTIK
jgi:hypothetical protein